MADGKGEDSVTRDGSLGERLASVVVHQSQIVVAVLLVSSLVLGAGVLILEVETGFIEVGDLPEREAQEYVKANFTGDRQTGSVLVLVEGDDVISQEVAQRQIAAERRLLENETVRTDPDDPPIAFANAIAALVAYQIDSGDDNVSEEILEHRRKMLEAGNLTYGPGERTHPPLERQASILKRLSDDSYEGARRTVVQAGGDAFLPSGYEEGPANETILVVPIGDPGPDPASHAAVEAIVDDEIGDGTRAFSGSLYSIELERAIQDSLFLVGPLGFLFVLAVLWVAYRDPIDIALGGLGIALVLVWMFGFLGWTGIGFNQVFVAAPILVIGLSVDYMFHVLMRYREHAGDSPPSHRDDVRRAQSAMMGALAGVGVALAIVSGTTILGFLSNVTSPVPTVREFGLIGAFSILSIFVVFAVLLPAVRVEIDRRLSARGSLDVRSAIGRGDRLGSLLAVPARFAWNAPKVVFVLAIATGIASAYAATLLLPTAFTTFLPRDPNPWLYALPEPFSPGDYHFLETADELRSVFGYGGREGRVLVRGDVASTAALERVARGSRTAGESPILAQGSPEEPAIRSPVTVMETVAAENESFNETLYAADTTGDAIPDRYVEAVYDELYRVAPERASSVIYRTDGEYRALLVRFAIRTGVQNDRLASELGAVAASIDGDGVVGDPGEPGERDGGRHPGDRRQYRGRDHDGPPGRDGIRHRRVSVPPRERGPRARHRRAGDPRHGMAFRDDAPARAPTERDHRADRDLHDRARDRLHHPRLGAFPRRDRKHARRAGARPHAPRNRRCPVRERADDGRRVRPAVARCLPAAPAVRRDDGPDDALRLCCEHCRPPRPLGVVERLDGGFVNLSPRSYRLGHWGHASPVDHMPCFAAD